MRLFSLVSATVFAVAALAVTPDASAQRNRGQAATTVYVNYQRVVTESAIGRDWNTRFGQVRAQISGELQALAPESQAIEQEGQRLQNTLRNQSPEQIRNNAQARAFAERQQNFNRRAATLQGDLECTQLLTLRDLRNQIAPVVRQVMQSRGAGIAVDASGAFETLPEFDITATVIQQLDGNQSTRAATVARHSVSECQAPAAQ